MTELELRAEGVTFTRKAGTIQPFGPADRTDLRDALRAEIEKRTAVLFEQIKKSDARHPAAYCSVRPGQTKPRSGWCDSCGDPIGNGVGGWCALCSMALQKALVQEGRLKA